MTSPPSGTVTFLFTDIEGSTRLWEERPDEMRAALAEHDALVRGAIDAHGGYVFSTGGDGFAVAFSRAHDAVDAARKAQAALAVHPLIRVRIGIHTGEVQERDGDYFGPAVNRAARIMAVGHGGQVLLSAVTQALVASAEVVDLGEHRLRDLTSRERVFQLGEARFPPLRSLDAFPTNLPFQVHELLGREDESLATVTALTERRVVTLTGAGGVGKTRLALHVAADLTPRYPDGTWVVELAPISEENAVAGAVAAALGVQQRAGLSMTESLVEYLRSKCVLLVLDNCEHLLDGAAALIDALLAGCGAVRVLATSREPLGVAGERVQRVGSLAVPEAGLPAAEMALVAGVALFVDRAQATGASFRLDESTATAVGEIVRRLDGIPLALELAAARAESLGAVQIATHLGERFRLLTGGPRARVERHRTLRSAVEWSFNLLAAAEQRSFVRLSVFAGGFSIDAACAVVSDAEVDALDVLEHVASLVSKSMVIAEHHGDEVRYRLLETLRQFGADLLRESGEADAIRARHARFFAEFADDAEPGLCGADEARWVKRVAQNLDNMRAAFDWAVGVDDVDVALRIGSAAGRFGWGRMATGALGLAYDAIELRGAEHHPLFPWVAGWAAFAAYLQGEPAKVASIRAAADDCRARTGGRPNSWLYGTLAHALMQLGEGYDAEMFALAVSTAREHSPVDVPGHLTAPISMADVLRRDPDRSVIEEAITLARRTGNPTTTALTLMSSSAGMESERGLAALTEAVMLADQVDNTFVVAHSLRLRSMHELRLRDASAALVTVARAFELFERARDRIDLLYVVGEIARTLTELGHDHEAAKLFGALVDGPLAFAYQSERRMALDTLLRRLGRQAFEAALEQGRSMSREEMLTFAKVAIAKARTS